MDLSVYSTKYQKIRVGSQNDGGYVICDANIEYDLLLSGGISTNTDFEDQFLEFNKEIECIGYDGTIDKSPSKNPRFKFLKQNIGGSNNLHEILETYKTVFVKMDIEGHEFAWLESLKDDHLNNIAQIAIEFHFPTFEWQYSAYSKLLKNHVLVHIHGNNCCGKRNNIPNVFECTFLHKRYVEYPTLSAETFPTPLDMPNLPQRPDLNEVQHFLPKKLRWNFRRGTGYY
jgi:hypothetical protein